MEVIFSWKTRVLAGFWDRIWNEKWFVFQPVAEPRVWSPDSAWSLIAGVCLGSKSCNKGGGHTAFWWGNWGKLSRLFMFR